MSINVTFKLHKRETGLRAVGFSTRGADIKIKRRTFGTINAPNWQTPDNCFTVSIMIMCRTDEEREKHGAWRWITFKARHDSMDDAKQWINYHLVSLMEKYTFRYMDKGED